MSIRLRNPLYTGKRGLSFMPDGWYLIVIGTLAPKMEPTTVPTKYGANSDQLISATTSSRNVRRSQPYGPAVGGSHIAACCDGTESRLITVAGLNGWTLLSSCGKPGARLTAIPIPATWHMLMRCLLADTYQRYTGTLPCS